MGAWWSLPGNKESWQRSWDTSAHAAPHAVPIDPQVLAVERDHIVVPHEWIRAHLQTLPDFRHSELHAVICQVEGKPEGFEDNVHPRQARKVYATEPKDGRRHRGTVVDTPACPGRERRPHTHPPVEPFREQVGAPGGGIQFGQ